MAEPQIGNVPHVRDWALLFYVCADVPLSAKAFPKSVGEHLAEVAGSIYGFDLTACHVFVQIDTPYEGATRWRLVSDDGACRFELAGAHHPVPESGAEPSSEKLIRLPTRINTGDPNEAVDFLKWAMSEGPALHNAVIVSGLGISRQNVQWILRDTKSFGREEQIKQFQAQNLFSICHDASHLDALEAHELRGIIEKITVKLGRRLDVVVFDADLTAFIELAYQLRDLADYCVAAAGIVPATLSKRENNSLDVWPWSDLRIVLASCWRIPNTTSAESIAKQIATAFNTEFARRPDRPDSRMVALRLQPITEAVGLLNHLTSLLLQSMGDWHVLNALLTVWREWKTLWSVADSPSPKDKGRHQSDWDDDIDRCDVFQFLLLIEAALSLEVANTPSDFEMLVRIKQVLRVATRVRTELVPNWLSQRFLSKLDRKLHELDELEKAEKKPAGNSAPSGDTPSDHPCETPPHSIRDGVAALKQIHQPPPDSQQKPSSGKKKKKELSLQTDERLFLPLELDESDPRSTELLMLLPWPQDLNYDVRAPLRSKDRKHQNAVKVTPPQDNCQASYGELDFARDAGWPLLVTALQLITWKPHVLWRIVSSMLFSRSGTTRDVMLRRLFSSRSVLSDMQTQFRAFKSEQSLRLSVRLAGHGGGQSARLLESRPLDAAPSNDCEHCHGQSDRENFRLELESPSGEAVVSENFSPVYRSTFRTAMRSFNEIVNGDGSLSDAVSVLEQLGCSMGEDVIQDLRDRLEAEHAKLAKDTDLAPHLRLQIDPELMPYPWELISDGHGMLFERFSLGRQFFMPPRRRTTKRETRPLRVLVLGDPVFHPNWIAESKLALSQLPGAVREAHAVVDLFRDLREDLNGIVEVWIEHHIGESITFNQVRGWLRSGDYDIIHFAGHACFNVDDPEGSGWLLSDGLLHAREIRNTLEWSESPPWLVYANACEAGMDRASSLADYGYQTDVYGLSSAFTAHGVRGYIAPLWPINDEVAVLLATEFYCTLLLDRRSLGESLSKAKSIAKRLLVGTPGTAQGSQLPARTALSWASVVLYGDPTQNLFQSLWGGAVSSDKAGDPHATPDGFTSSGSSPRSDDHSPFEKAQPNHKPMTLERRRRFMPRIQQAPLRQVLEAVQSPTMIKVDVSRSMDELPNRVEKALELVEVDGIRQWMVWDRRTNQRGPIDSGGLMALTSQPEFRQLLGINRSRGDRSAWDYVWIGGKWALQKLVGDDDDDNQEALFKQFAKQWDDNTVKQPGLLEYQKGHVLVPVTKKNWQPLEKDERILLVIHGTFSSADSPKDGFKAEFWKKFPHRTGPLDPNTPHPKREQWRILFYNHQTLSESPEANADELATMLNELTLKDGQPLLEGLLKEQQQASGALNEDQGPSLPIDLIVHSRGGLVARAFCELCELTLASKKKSKLTRLIRHVVFLGTPNAGTLLAAPKNFGRLANYLLNLVHRDSTGLFGKLSSFLAESFVRWQMKANIPGLNAQNPETLSDPQSLLGRLHEGDTGIYLAKTAKRHDNQETWPKYLCVAANFEPGDLTEGFDISSINKFVGSVPELAKSLVGVGFDQLTDAFLNAPNDLVVDTASVWSLRLGRKQKCDPDVGVQLESVMLFNIDKELPHPVGLQLYKKPWIQHFNLFGQSETQEFILRSLKLQ